MTIMHMFTQRIQDHVSFTTINGDDPIQLAVYR